MFQANKEKFIRSGSLKRKKKKEGREAQVSGRLLTLQSWNRQMRFRQSTSFSLSLSLCLELKTCENVFQPQTCTTKW